MKNSDNTMLWTAEAVAARLEEAAQALRRLPRPKEIRHLKGRWSLWPEVVRQASEAYGYGEPERVVIPPSAREIDRMDEAVVWLLWLEKREAKLVWLRCSGIAWRDLEYVFHRNTRTLQRWYRGALETVALRLGTRDAAATQKIASEAKKDLSRMSRFGYT